MSIPFDSRSLYHKKPFGAVCEGKSVTLCVAVPREADCRAVRLVIRREGGDTQRLDFSRETDGERWTLTFCAGVAGLYRYHFELDSSVGGRIVKLGDSSRGVISSNGEGWSLTVFEGGFETPEWLRGATMYQIFPDRFFASGTKKQNVPDERLLRDDTQDEPLWEPDADGRVTKYDFFGGDLEGIRQKLGYLASLGVSCVYLNPIFEAHSNHRYDTADYMRVDPLLGGEDDFCLLCADAKKLGIHVILDGVFSHVGADSRYFNKFSRYPDAGAYNSRSSKYYPWFRFSEWPSKYDCWWNVDILPEVNEDEPSFSDFINGDGGVARHWLALGADGWRLDVADELTDGFLERFRRAVKVEKQDAFVLGEVWENAADKVSYGRLRSYLLGHQLDSVMNYPFADAVLNFVRSAISDGFLDKIMTVLESYPPQCVAGLMNHIGTHDTARAITRLVGAADGLNGQNRHAPALTHDQKSRGIALMKCAAAIQFTLPGIPCIYYGDEAGLEGGLDPFNRACYPWGRENAELLGFYRALGALRTDSPALRDGEFIPVSDALGCVAFAREKNGVGLITIVNRNFHSIDYRLPWHMRVREIAVGDAVVDGSTVTLGADSAVIIHYFSEGA